MSMSLLSQLMQNKPLTYLLGGLVIFIILVVTLTGNQLPTAKNEIPSTTERISPAPSSPFTNQQERYLDKVAERSSLSSNDIMARDKILLLLPSGQKSGQLYRSPTISIEYISTANIFQVEILTSDISGAKIEAEDWFKSYGFSHEGICNYPVSFYLNYDVKSSMNQDAIDQFNPLPEDC